ncbi:MAG: hypothetical protein U9R08_07230, partial [Nanoarchaeota archaeon]|nr:hypothetical protein [Nanoarchaeota archaeon]
MRKSLLMGLCMVFLVVLVSSIVSAEVTLDEQWQKVNTNTLNLIVDDLGNTYGLVWTYDFIDNTYFIVKYDVDGNQLWNTPLPVDSNNYWTSMQIDSNGNVYVAGRRSDSRSIRAKLSSNGVLEWKKTGPINFESRFVVQNDVPYLLRYSRAYPVIQHARFFLVNSVTGDVNKLFDFGYIGDDLRVYSRFLTATNSGDFYALNYFYGGQVDRLIKFDVAGNILWDNVLSQLSEYSFYSMDVDSQDNVYIVYDNLDGVNGMNLVKYDSNGNQLWVKENVLSSAHVDENDNIFTFDMDDNVEKYNSDGVLLWETLVPEPMLSTLNALQAGTYNYNIYIGRAISHNGDLLFHTIMHDDFAGSYVESNIIKYNILGECVCSDTFCNPVHDGTVCDGCNYVAAPVEVCGDGVDNDCDG